MYQNIAVETFLLEKTWRQLNSSVGDWLHKLWYDMVPYDKIL